MALDIIKQSFGAVADGVAGVAADAAKGAIDGIADRFSSRATSQDPIETGTANSAGEGETPVGAEDETKASDTQDGGLSAVDAEAILSMIYGKAINGIPKVSKSVDELADDYRSKKTTPEKAAISLAKNQVVKCGTSGFLTGLGGVITLPVTIPANIGSVLYVQMRMVAAIAKLGGYDVRSDQVQTLVYMCLTGTAITDMAKQVGIRIGEKTLEAAIKRIPGTALKAINQKIGFRLLTKFGEKGVINLGKMVPLAGGVVGGAFDVVTTTTIAKNAIKVFIEDETPDGSSLTDAEMAIVESVPEESSDIVEAEFEIVDDEPIQVAEFSESEVAGFGAGKELLQDLEELLAAGILTEEEFESKTRKLAE